MLKEICERNKLFDPYEIESFEDLRNEYNRCIQSDSKFVYSYDNKYILYGHEDNNGLNVIEQSHEDFILFSIKWKPHSTFVYVQPDNREVKDYIDSYTRINEIFPDFKF